MDFVAAARAASLAGVLDIARQATHQVTSAARTSQATADGMPGIARVYASELLDKNTCDPCAGVDGKEYASVEAAHADYREHGGFRDCGGGLRCRGTLVFVYDTETPTVGVPAVAPPEPPTPMSLDVVYEATSRVDWDRATTINGDEWLGALYEQRGFDALPHRTVDPNGVTLFRGMAGPTPEDTARYVDGFVNGPRHYPGFGLSGDGSYASTAESTALAYADNNPAGVVRFVLDSDARIIDGDDAARLARTWQERVTRQRTAAEQAKDWDAVERLDHLLDVVQDPGRVAVIEGYDAIHLTKIGRLDESYYVVLNRGKVGVQ